MQGGTTHPVPVIIEKCGTAIAWEFSTEPKGIAFGIVYKSTSENSQEYEVCHIMHYVPANKPLTCTLCMVSAINGHYILLLPHCIA